LSLGFAHRELGASAEVTGVTWSVAMSAYSVNRNVLFGILALEMGFITRDDFIAAIRASALERHRPIGEVLVEKGALDPDCRAMLEPLVDGHVKRHDGDPASSLAALAPIGLLASALREAVRDADAQAAIAHIPVMSVSDPYATVPPGGAPETAGYDPVAIRYRKIRDHAKGGLGIVYVAQDEELKREVALKEIQDHYADDNDKRARFIKEAEITGGLAHPGIVPVYGLGTYADGRPYYAMRFIKGNSLKDAIAEFHANLELKKDHGARALALQKLLRRFLDVCNAVGYAHSRGVLHRDLKPANVMIGDYGETLVVDWGLAKAVGRSDPDSYGLSPESAALDTPSRATAQTMPGSVIGTPAYMSPEQAAGRLDLLGATSDVYSLGATLYTLLTGSVPFEGSDIREILGKVKRGEFRRPREQSPWLDPALEAICLKAMATRSDARYPSTKALSEDIERSIADEPVSAYPEPWSKKSQRFVRRHRTLVATSLVATVLIGIGLAWYQVRQARLSGEAVAALGEADRLGASGQLAAAVAAAVRADDLLRAGGGPNSLQRLAQARRRALQDEFDRVKRAETLAKELDEAQLRGAAIKNGRFDDDARLSAYERAFRSFGVDVLNTEPPVAAAQLRDTVATEIAAAVLGDWSRFVHDDVRDRLLEIANRIDSDPTRMETRGPIVVRGPNSEPLAKLAREVDVAKHPPVTLRELSRRLGRVGRRADGLALLERAQVRHPDDFWINHELGIYYSQEHPPRLDKAVSCHMAAVALRPSSPGAHFNLGVTLNQQGDRDGAIAAYRETIRLEPNFSEAYSRLGNALAAKGDIDGALVAIRESIRLGPQDVNAHSSLGISLQLKGDLEGAMAAYREAIRLDPKDADDRSNLGALLHRKGDLDGAIAAFREALKLEPRLARAHFNLGNTLRDKGDIDGAIAEWQAAAEIEPDEKAYSNLGRALLRQGNYAAAVSAFRECTRLKPNDSEGHNNLGTALNQIGDYAGAIASYRAAIRLKPDDAVVHYNLGNTMDHNGDLDGAIAAYSEAIRLKPDDVTYVNLGKVLFSRKNYDEAISNFRKAIRLNPENSDAHCNLGNALGERGDDEGAIAACRAAIRLKPDFAEAFCILGRSLRAQARYSEAFRAMERGHELGSRTRGWRYPSQEWVEEFRTLARLEAKLADVLTGRY
jgi:tetratricopeptide (TPR) repeat protein/tRNA A-37 threonylcarbamoyl transferase component Bud32